jgi:hypothetical protein
MKASEPRDACPWAPHNAYNVGAHARCVTFIRSQVRWSVRVLEQDEQNGQIVRPWSSPFDKSLIFQLQAKTNLLRVVNICHCSLVIAFPFAEILPALARFWWPRDHCAPAF